MNQHLTFLQFSETMYCKSYAVHNTPLQPFIHMQLQPLRVQLRSHIASRQQASFDRSIEVHRLTAHTMDARGIQV